MAILTQGAIDFLAELELNNNREWFTANKTRYEKSVKGPMEELAGDLIERLKSLGTPIEMSPKSAVFRIYRDTRFSKDKTPYKTNAGLSISAGGKTGHGHSGVYVHLDPRTFGIASGHYFLDPAQISLMRRHIADNLEEFQQQLDDKPFKKTFGTVRGEVNKVLPVEFRDAARIQPLLFNKQFYYWAEYEPEAALNEDLSGFVMEHVKAAAPMNEFLARALSS